MKDLNKKYDEIFELREQNEETLNLYQAMKMKEYECCEHILVYSEIEHDICEERTYKSCGCIKCGLDSSVLNRDREYRKCMTI